MTTEQKAKAYDEALEKARKYHAAAKSINDPSAARYENIFPELRESEDERIRKDLIHDIEGLPVQGVLTHRPTSEYIAYLEKQEQKSAWSEEDEKMIDTIVSVLGQYIDYKAVSGTGSGYATPRYNKEIAWLKSLRPRPSWKPSEVHLSALLAIFNDPDNIGSQTCQLALTDLYEQLKKL